MDVSSLTSFDSWDFILAALFLWIIFFFAARSVKETAFVTPALSLDFLARRIAISSLLTKSRLTLFLFSDPLRALFAVFVTGILMKKTN